MRWILLVAMLPVSVFAGQYNVCTDAAGKKTFQEQPCGGGVTSEVKTYQVSAPSSDAVYDLPTDDPRYIQMRDDNLRAQLSRDIKKTESNIERYRSALDRELSVLRAKKSRANNNLAGAAWEQSISVEMQAVSDRYASQIDAERDVLNALRSELAGL